MVFVDASALIAIVTGEPEAALFAEIIEVAGDCLCSAVSVWESVAGLQHSYGFTVSAARAQVRLFLSAGNFAFVNIGEREFEIAAEAYERFGQGRHPAKLNMGDCFAYACATANGAALLFKASDFGQTDVIVAG